MQSFPEPLRLAPGVEFLGLRDERFKRVLLRVHWELPLDADSPARTLLLQVLEQGSAEHPRRLDLARSLQEAYGADLDFGAERSGECHQAALRLSCVGERFLPAGEQALPGLLRLAREVLDRPRRGAGGAFFEEEILERERAQLLRRIAALRDDRSAWAEQRFLETMCAGEAYARSPWGTEAEVAALGAKDLERARTTLLREARVIAVMIGPDDPGSGAEFLAEWFAGRSEPAPAREPAARRPGARRHLREELACDQARFLSGFRCAMPADPVAREGLALATSVLGGGVHGRLFRIVREQRSQAYSIHAQLRARKGLMTVEAGLDAAHAESVRAEVDTQIENLQQHGALPEEMEHARRSLCDRLLGLDDRASSLASYLVRERSLGLSRSPAERVRYLEQLRSEDVAIAARRWLPDLDYLLAPPVAAAITA